MGGEDGFVTCIGKGCLAFEGGGLHLDPSRLNKNAGETYVFCIIGCKTRPAFLKFPPKINIPPSSFFPPAPAVGP